MRILIALLLTSLASLVCNAAESPWIRVGNGTEYQLIGNYSIEAINKRLKSDSDSLHENLTVDYQPAKNAVTLYRVKYLTTIPEQNNHRILASGLIAIPAEDNKSPLPLVSWQHGTITSKQDVPSNPNMDLSTDLPGSTEARLVTGVFAAQGYAVFMPDYTGKGLSPGNHPYMLANSTTTACYDMLEAGKRVLSALKIKLSDAVFLGGWSQGGFASLGLLKKLETINQPVRAVVSASGTFDLYLSWQNWLNKTPSAYVPTIMALVVASYQEFYGLKGLLDEAVKPENKQLVQDCFKNGCSNEYVLQKMPATPEKMFNRAFLESSYIGDTRFYKLLRLNELYRWKLHTPTRYYFGEADTLQYNFPETMPVNYLQSMGAPAEAVNTGKESTHRDTFLVALADAKKWFDSLQTAKK